MRIAIGSDHRGRDVLRFLIEELRSRGHTVFEPCADDSTSVDYPDTAYPVAMAVASEAVDMGILVDGSGIGMSIAANKVKGVRAALVHDEVSADMSRRHNDANVLCLPADMLGHRIIGRIVSTWLKAQFDGGRHARRVAKIAAIENGVEPTRVQGETDWPIDNAADDQRHAAAE